MTSSKKEVSKRQVILTKLAEIKQITHDEYYSALRLFLEESYLDNEGSIELVAEELGLSEEETFTLLTSERIML